MTPRPLLAIVLLLALMPAASSAALAQDEASPPAVTPARGTGSAAAFSSLTPKSSRSVLISGRFMYRGRRARW